MGQPDEVIEAIEHDRDEGKAAHPIELFFDLVYVFAFTRVVGLVLHDHSLAGTLKGALLLGLLWWSWGGWTWAMNAVDLTNRFRRVLILISMIFIFLMGYSVSTAFEGDGLWFAAGYLGTRILQSAVMWFGTVDDEVEHASIRQYLPMSFIAPAIVLIGGAIDGDSLPWLWLLALLIEVGSVLIAGQNEWHVDAEHFAERHGLIMIIALGEAIIAVGVALTGDDVGVTAAVAWRLGVGLIGVGVMWWAYFDRMQSIWERRLHEADVLTTGRIARDLYTLSHYPMITGVVFYAVALEDAFHHPEDPLSTFGRWMLVTSVALYLLSQAAATYRAWGGIQYERMVGVGVIALLVAFLEVKAEAVVIVVIAVMTITMSAEYWRFREQVKANPHLRR